MLGSKTILISGHEISNYGGHKGRETMKIFRLSKKKTIRMRDEEMFEGFCTEVGGFRKGDF